MLWQGQDGDDKRLLLEVKLQDGAEGVEEKEEVEEEDVEEEEEVGVEE